MVCSGRHPHWTWWPTTLVAIAPAAVASVRRRRWCPRRVAGWVATVGSTNAVTVVMRWIVVSSTAVKLNRWHHVLGGMVWVAWVMLVATGWPPVEATPSSTK